MQKYLKVVMGRANHHAPNVNGIVLALIGAIVWKKADDIQVLDRMGELKNVLWVHIEGVRYAFSYSHETEAIEMRKGSIQGDVLHRFDNSTPFPCIKDIFEAL